MPYLSRVYLNPLRSGAQRLLQSPHAMHAAVEAVLPPERSGRLLWRTDVEPRRCELLVLSPDRPTFDHVVEQAGWPGNEHGEPRVADLSPLLGTLALGRRFGFRLVANPTRSSRSPQGAKQPQMEQVAASRRGVRLGHRTVRNQLQWFTDRAAGDAHQWGFTVGDSPTSANVQVTGRRQLRFRPSTGSGATLDTASFERTLTVTDVDRLRSSLLEGLGRGKAYGCGLLTLAPVRGDDVVAG